MKKLYKFFQAFFVSAIVALALAGCGKVNTTLTINADKSGERLMEITITKDEFNREVTNGTIEDVVNVTRNGTPEVLNFNYRYDDTNYYFEFRMPFTSLTDYDAKMNSLLNDSNNEAKLETRFAESLWEDGFYIKDPVDPMDPLEFFKSLMVENGFVAENHRNDFIEKGRYTLSYDGETYSDYYNNTYDTMSYTTVFGVNIDTIIYGIDSFDRTYTFSLNSSTYNRSIDGDKFVDYFKGLAGRNAEVSFENNKVIASFSALTAKDIAEIDNKFFKDASFEMTFEGNGRNVFSTRYNVKESFDITGYIVEDRNTSFRVSSSIDARNGFSRGENNLSMSIYKDAEGKYAKYEGTAELSRNYTVSACTVEFDFNDVDDIDAVINIELADKVSKEEEKSISQAISTKMSTPSVAAADVPETEKVKEKKDKFKFDYTDSNKKDVYSGKIKFSGDADAIREGLVRLTSNPATVSVNSNKSATKSKYDKIVELNFNMGTVLSKRTDNFAGELKLNLGKGAKVISCTNSVAIIDKNVITAKLDTYNNYYTVKAECKNGGAVVLKLVIWVVVIAACAVAFLVLKKSGKIGSSNKAPKAKASSEAKKSFCPQCGAECSGTAFCAKCGAKLG